MKRKKTKKALSGSVLALVLCFVMLIGTTFAWFTSSDSTAVNKIEAGTLDVDLMMKEGDNWVSATNQVLSFIDKDTNNLWEPGCTYTLPTIQVVNNGNLALKYKVVVSAVLGDGNLAEVLDVLYSDTAKSVTNKNVGTLSDVLNSTDKDGFAHGNLTAKGTAGDKSGEITLSLHMQELAGNAYQGKSIKGLTVTVYATQDTVEYDSTRNDYDKDATLPDVNAVPTNTIATVATENEYVVLTDNVSGAASMTSLGNSSISSAYIIKGGTFDGNGNSITLDKKGYGVETTGGTIKNVTIDSAGRGIMTYSPDEDVYIDNVQILNCGYGINGAGHAGNGKLIVTNSTLNGWISHANIASASFKNCSFGTSTFYTKDIYRHTLRPYVTTTVTDCEFDSGYYIQLYQLGSGCTLTLENCTCNGVKLTADNITELMKIAIESGKEDDVYATSKDKLPTTLIIK